MLDVIMYIKESGYGTGVTVSANHLKNVLLNAGITSDIAIYKDDVDLLQQTEKELAKIIMLQVPTFSNETLKLIVNRGRKVILATHSTMCNLQVEGDALSRLLEIANWGSDNLYITCPSKVEVEAFNSFSKTKFFYLPNTYSYSIDDNAVIEKILSRNQDNGPLKISIFCAIRAFKNILTQMTAVSLLSKKMPNIELHLLEGNDYLSDCINQLGDFFTFNVVRHASCSNEELLKIISDMHLGMQVSLSETFSYIAYEHMSNGVPVVASSSVPYATEIVDYSDANMMAEKMFYLLTDRNNYLRTCQTTLKKSKQIREEINNDAIELIKTILMD